MAARLTILRVGALVALVGQGCSGTSRPSLVAPTAGADLEIAPLDGGAGAHELSAGDGVRFGHPAPSVGDAWVVRVDAASRADEQVSTYESEVRIEVIEVDGPAPSRVKLRFARNAHTYQGTATPTSIDGKEYVVDARAPHVRDGSNGAAPESEAQRVLDVFPDLGTRARIDEVLPDEAMRVGARHDELAAAVLRVIHPRAWTLRAGSATLTRVEGEYAVFATSLDASSESGLRMQVAGESRVRLANSRLEDLSLEGTYDTTTAAGVEVTGTFSLRRRVTSGQAPRSAR